MKPARPSAWLASVLSGRVSQPLRDCRDWPAQLRLNAASVLLARALYHGSGEIYGFCCPAFEALATAEKHRLIGIAAEALKQAKPLPVPVEVATGLGPTHGPVIGAIGPKGAA